MIDDGTLSKLNPAFSEWLMGLPEGHVTNHGLDDKQVLKMCGNGVCPQAAAMALRLLGFNPRPQLQLQDGPVPHGYVEFGMGGGR